MIIAIDGPSGAGSLRLPKRLPKSWVFSCLDTGAMYRAVAWKALQEGSALLNGQALTENCAKITPLVFGHEEGNPVPKASFFAMIKEITDEIRTAKIDKSVSAVSAVPGVRQAFG